MLKIYKNKAFFLFSFLFPPFFVFAFAQQINSVKDLIGRIVSIIELIIPVLIGFAVVVFIWGIVDFIIHANNEQKKTKGKMLMTWGIVGIFAMVSVWGIVEVLHSSFF